MKVLHAAAEVYPLVKTGGLADVTAALPPALAEAGADVRLLLPGLPAVLEAVQSARTVVDIGACFGALRARLLLGRMPGSHLPVYVVDAPHLYRRRGGPYQDDDGSEWPDNLQRFALLGWVAAHLAADDADGLQIRGPGAPRAAQPGRSTIRVFLFIPVVIVLVIVVVPVVVLVFILVFFFLLFLFFVLVLLVGPAFRLGRQLEVHLVPGLDVEFLDVAVEVFDLDQFRVLIDGEHTKRLFLLDVLVPLPTDRLIVSAHGSVLARLADAVSTASRILLAVLCRRQSTLAAIRGPAL